LNNKKVVKTSKLKNATASPGQLEQFVGRRLFAKNKNYFKAC